MVSRDTWWNAGQPNYSTNTNLMYPYSDIDHIGRPGLVKYPVALNDLIQHVDYWGEGRVVTGQGVSGFPNSYNVHHQHQLVSCGPDRGKKIPNRIPVISFTDCDTKPYLKDNSVLTVTVVGARLNDKCAIDIARIVNRDHGTVVVFGMAGDSKKIAKLTEELNKKLLQMSRDWPLPSELQGLTYFKCHVAYPTTATLQFFRHSITLWDHADLPNYSTNIDLVFPYSSTNHTASNFVKVPVSSKYDDLVKHVDYWGEGRVVTGEGISGFPHSYNVNHVYRLVSSGADRDKLIPNRIPVQSYVKPDTSPFIKDNTVHFVTIAGALITSESCIKDIARIVNKDHGMVVAYGVHDNSQKILQLTEELKKKGLFPWENGILPSELQGLTYYDSHLVFFCKNDLAKETYNDVVKGDYDSAVKMTKNVDEAIKDIVPKLIKNAPQTVMIYAQELWNGGSKDIVRQYFPKPYTYILNGDAVMITNKAYNMRLKVKGKKDVYSEVLGDVGGIPETYDRFKWNILFRRYKDKHIFALHNTGVDECIKRHFNEHLSHRLYTAWQVKPTDDLYRSEFRMFYIEPLIENNGDVVFAIMNIPHQERLALNAAEEELGDRLLIGEFTRNDFVEERSKWVITPWTDK